MAEFQKGVEATIVFHMWQMDGLTPATGRTLTCKTGKDGGDYGAADNSATELSLGAYKYTLSADEMDGDVVYFTAIEAGETLRFAITIYPPTHQSGAANITLGQVQYAAPRTGRTTSPITLDDTFQDESKPHVITVTDADGDPVDMSAKTLRFVAHDDNEPPNGLFKVDSGSIAVTGDNNNIVTVTFAPADTATACHYLWELRDTADNDSVWAHGTGEIVPAVTDVT